MSVDWCRVCWLFDNDQRYRTLWSGEPVKEMPRRCKGPGDHFSKIASQLGFKGCLGCKMLAAKMNAWGPQGCREHMAEIVEGIRENATLFSWWGKLKAGFLAPWNGLPLSLEGLVEEAIKRAEADCKSTPEKA